MTAGKLNRTSPFVAVSTGPVKTSPSGKLRSPLAAIQVRPSTPTVRSVPSESTRSSRTCESCSASVVSRAAYVRHAPTGSAVSSQPARKTKSAYASSDMPASWANASHGTAVTHQRRSPDADRSMNWAMSG